MRPMSLVNMKDIHQHPQSQPQLPHRRSRGRGPDPSRNPRPLRRLADEHVGHPAPAATPAATPLHVHDVEASADEDSLLVMTDDEMGIRVGDSPNTEVPLAEWNDVLAVNLTGAMVCCQAVLPGMASRRQGRIVFIGSLAGRTTPRIAGASYSASKSGLTGLMRAIVSEHSAAGVTANTICPGRILTEMAGDPRLPANQAALARIPCGRFGQPDDVARLVSFLIADDADFINGATIDLNGGEFVAP